MRRGTTGAARRYARALLDVVAAQGGDAGQLQRELAAAADALAGHAELRRALTHPGVPAEGRRRLAAAVFADASPLMRRLLDMLVDRGRVLILAELNRHFTAMLNEQRGVLAAEAVSAVELEPAQRGRIATALAAATGKQVELTTSVEPALLGGVVVRMGGRTYDGSVRARLIALEQTLSGRAAGA